MPAPVALFVYKRPDHTLATLNALARNTLAGHTRLYVFCDGPKTPAERETVTRVRDIARNTSGFASTTIVERSENFGLARSIISGVSTLFEEYEKVIVLEDDLVTTPYFLAYMNDALNHYQNDPQAFSVTGHTYPKEFLPIPHQYSFDTYAGHRCSSWSWGTWKNRWELVDWEMSYFPSFIQDAQARLAFSQGGDDLPLMLQMQYRGMIDSWAIRFCYAHYAHRMRCIYPTKTLVRNIGLDNSGTHSKPDPRFQHLHVDDAWRPERFCPASDSNEIINTRFRALFSAPHSGSQQSFLKKATRRLTSLLTYLCRLATRIRGVLSPTPRPVDILFCSTYESHGGAARAAFRLFKGIRSRYPNSLFLSLFRESADSGVIGLANTTVRGALAWQSFDRDRKLLATYPGYQGGGFSPAISPNPFRIRLSRLRPKLLHLHWIGHGFLKIEELGQVNCPVLWTLHDAWAFTGGCHYPNGCEGHKTQCGCCPQLASSSATDLSHQVLIRKNKTYSNLNLTLVAPSRWLSKLAESSTLFAGQKVEVIPNGLDTTAFQPIDRIAARSYFGISSDRPVFLFGSHWLNDRRKGGDLLCEALAILDAPCTLLTFGEGTPELSDAPKVKLLTLGSLNDNASLAMAYSAADAFLCPSREDNLPNTVAEALSCGTPCIAFNANGLPEMIEHEKTGWLAEPFSPKELAKGLQWIMNHNNPEALRIATRAKALAEYSLEKATQRYAELYERIMNSAANTD